MVHNVFVGLYPVMENALSYTQGVVSLHGELLSALDPQCKAVAISWKQHILNSKKSQKKLFACCLSHLFKSDVDQFVAGRLPHGKTQTVDGMQGCTQEATQAKLLPLGQPSVQPIWEAVVLGAPPQLEESAEQTRQVDQRKHHQGHGGKSDVNSLDGHFVEDTLPCCDVGLQDVTDEVVQVEEEEQGHGADDRDVPGGKQIEGDVFDLQRRGEEAHIDGDEAHSMTELHHRALGLAAVAAQENLEKIDDKELNSEIRILSLPNCPNLDSSNLFFPQTHFI